MNQSRVFELDISDNRISGEIPNWIWNVGNGSVFHLNLSFNLLVNFLREYISPGLEIVDLHSNQLRGEILVLPESSLYVDFSNNNFSSSIPVDIGNNLANSVFFSLSSNMLTGAIPQSICNANLQVLDFSNNRFSGTIPRCLIESSTANLRALNLKNNNHTGSVEGTFLEGCDLHTLDLSGNKLEGQVPKSLANCKYLEVLNLGNNNINDTFPCFLKKSSTLRVLVLWSNKFQGDIQCQGVNKNSWTQLQIIDLASNNFSGVLPPKFFLDWKVMIDDMRNAGSKLDLLQFWVMQIDDREHYYKDKVTVTNKGLQMELVKILTIFTSIDFSNNSFQGQIPDTFGALKSLYVLNLLLNAFPGRIPSSLGNLTELGSLDLSQNKLSGSIPVELASLTYLSFLNLSYNHLVGMILTGTQLQSFSETSFEGNPGLCAPPLNDSCMEAEAPGLSRPTSDDQAEINWVYICATLGFSTGFGFVVGPLLYSPRWRKCYYKHVDGLISRIFR